MSFAQVSYSVSTNVPVWAIFLAVVVGLLFYVYFAYMLMKMADRLGVENSWFAFIPFLNYWLMTQMAGRDSTFFIILLISAFCCPIVTIVMVILLFMDIARNLGFEEWWGILMIVPIFNLYVAYKLALTEPY